MVVPLTGLKLVDFLGVFYQDAEGRLMVADELEGARDVVVELAHLAGREVRFLAHHRPLEPPDRQRWGGGCCFHEPAGQCPFGHHNDPLGLYTFNQAGRLTLEEGIQVGGVEVLTKFLPGHRSQVVVTSFPDIREIDEKIRSFDPSKFEGASFDELTEKLAELRDFMTEINHLKNDV